MKPNPIPSTLALHRIQELHDRYLELVKLEVEVFGVTATEVRHLIGRLGEFHCALYVGGMLSHFANQVGFDVVSPSGRRISVKTTAQKTGFVRIGASTLEHVDDLMVLRYAAGALELLYFGSVKHACAAARRYQTPDCYELDISKARALGAAFP